MKILVFSDSHGRQQNIKKTLEYHPDAQYIFHLGDGLRDLDGLESLCEGKEIRLVKGNAEDCSLAFNSYPSALCIDVCGKRIYLCHGHRHFVKQSSFFLMESATQNNADIILFGHSHAQYCEYIPSDTLKKERENGLYLFNPGSISLPRDGKPASYGIIEIKEKGVLFSHGNIDAWSKR